MTKKKNELTVPNAQKDDALFEALGKSKKKRKRKIIITVISIVLVLAIGAFVTVGALQRKVREQFASSAGEVLSYEVNTGTISTVVSGSGTLTDVDLEAVSVPEGVEVTEVLVKTNDAIAEGDVIATVDMATVVSAMADLQAEIEDLDEQISDAEDDEAEDVIKAGVSGRLKAIFAEEDKEVTDVMYEHGALALISLDGYMAVDVETDKLSAGESVTVKRADDSEISGTVESVSGGKATVLVSDNGTKYDEEVTVLKEDGTEVGKGKLYVHNALRVTGYAGTIERIYADENDKVSSSTKLFGLEDTSYSANYNSLLRSRSEKEETLLALLDIKKNGALVASVSGSVYSVDYSEESTEGETAIATLSLDEKMSVSISVDEADILSLELGQEVTVSVSSVSEDGFAGTLTEINRTSSESGTYSATVELEKAEGMLSGMTASVSVKIEGVDNAILVPIEAVHQTSDGAYVYTSYDEEYQEYGGKVDVVTGLENSTYIEIKSGLNVGDTVYYTESESIFGNFGGSMPGMGGGSMPDFGGGEMPDFGGSGMPDFSGGMPGSGGGMPGGFPGQ